MGNEYSRRNFLAGLGLTAGVTAASVSTSPHAKAIGLERKEDEPEKPPLQGAIVPFDGIHQAGISTPAQANVLLLAFTLKKNVGREEMRALMRVWTEDARKMASAKAPITDLEPEMYTIPANLTLTVGFGERFFEAVDRPDQKPEWLHDLPEYKTDKLEEQWKGGDVCLQLCCDDQVMLSHAARHMVRNGAPYLDMKWGQSGFQNASGGIKKGDTPRNLFGQLDGTVNPHSDEEYRDQVWITEGPDWLRGGSAMVVRRIDMNLNAWDVLDRASRETVTGRKLVTGAPMNGEKEHDPVDLAKTDEFGLPLTDPKSHVALAMPPKEHPNQKILRRVYSYDIPAPGDILKSDTGLVFICYQIDPMKQFNEIQTRLAQSDRLNEWITHIGSAVFVMPRGTAEGEYWAQDLLKD